MTDASIIVLTYNRSDLIDHRLTELMRLPLNDHGAEVLVFDNGSTDGTSLILSTAKTNWRNRGVPLRVERVADNRGFGGGFNEAVRHADGEFLFLLSNDVRVLGDFVERSLNELRRASGAIVVQQYISHPAGWNQFGDQVLEWAPGHFFAMHRGIWDQLGGFDEQFHPHDYEDVDFAYRAQQHGISFIHDPKLPLVHETAQTIGYNPDRYEHTIRMRSLFAEKHGLPNDPERP